MIDFDQRLVSQKDLPLFGKHIMLTTPRNYAGLFVKPLIERGAKIVSMPTIEIWPMEIYHELDQAIDQIDQYDWVVFSSQNGIEAFFSRLEAKQLGADHYSGAKLMAFRADAVPAEKKGVKFDLIPPKSTLYCMVDEFKRLSETDARLLLPVPEVVGMPEPWVVPGFVADLQHLGLNVHRVPAYMTCPVADPESLALEKKMLVDGDIDVVTFTSTAEMSSLVSLMGDDREVLTRSTLACLSYVEVKSAQELGLQISIVTERIAEIGLPEATVEAMEQYFRYK